MDNVTKMDLKRFLEDLEILQNQPFDDPQRTFEIWKDALEDVTLIEFEKAKKRLLQEWKYAKFPKPADLIERMDRVERSPYKPVEKPKEKTPEEIKAARIAREKFFKKVKELV